ncbi:MAG TPA: hypothetical protein VGM91_23995 [Conexibacter sp.]|jgi:hypothetical protein
MGRARPSAETVWRRRLLALAAVALAGVVVVLAARWIERLVRGYDPRGADVEHVVVHSRLLHRDLRQTLVAPAGGSRGRPLLVFLHGREDGGDGEDSNLSDELFAALARLGRRAPAIAFLNGGTSSYWHDRAGVPWGRYVLDEAIPAAARALGTDPRRVGSAGSRWAASAPSTSHGSRQRASAPSAATRRRSGSAAATRRPAHSTTPRTSAATT